MSPIFSRDLSLQTLHHFVVNLFSFLGTSKLNFVFEGERNSQRFAWGLMSGKKEELFSHPINRITLYLNFPTKPF